MVNINLLFPAFFLNCTKRSTNLVLFTDTGMAYI